MRRLRTWGSRCSSTVQITREEVFQIFLFAGTRCWLAEFLEDELLELPEIGSARFNFPPKSRVVTRVALGHEFLELAVGEDPAREFEGERVGIHAADVRVEKIVEINGRPPQFRVEIETTR